MALEAHAVQRLMLAAAVAAVCTAAAAGLLHARWSAPVALPAAPPAALPMPPDPRPAKPSFARFRPRPRMEGLGWRVRDYLSALGVLIVEVETRRLDDTVGIARALVEPLKGSYIEVLVYFSAPGQQPAAQRVQWTPERGYIRLDLAPPDR